MPKPDFEKMARDASREWRESVLGVGHFFELIAKQAYAAGSADERERCANIADTADRMKCGYSGDEWAHGFDDAQEYTTKLILSGEDN